MSVFPGITKYFSNAYNQTIADIRVVNLGLSTRAISFEFLLGQTIQTDYSKLEKIEGLNYEKVKDKMVALDLSDDKSIIFSHMDSKKSR